MTEEEAKTRDCCGPRMLATAFLLPHDRSAGGGLINRAARCIGAECMAWRWRKVPNPDWQDKSYIGGFPRTNPYSEQPAGIDSTMDGRCGLAGQD